MASLSDSSAATPCSSSGSGGEAGERSFFRVNSGPSGSQTRVRRDSNACRRPLDTIVIDSDEEEAPQNASPEVISTDFDSDVNDVGFDFKLSSKSAAVEEKSECRSPDVEDRKFSEVLGSRSEIDAEESSLEEEEEEEEAEEEEEEKEEVAEGGGGSEVCGTGGGDVSRQNGKDFGGKAATSGFMWSSCIASRTRSKSGFKRLKRVSYTKFFRKTFSDEGEDDYDDDNGRDDDHGDDEEEKEPREEGIARGVEVSQPPRLRFSSGKYSKKRKSPGTVSKPYTVNAEPDSDSKEEEVGKVEMKIMGGQRMDGSARGRGWEQEGKPLRKRIKRKHPRPFEYAEIYKLLLETIRNGQEELQDAFVHTKDESDEGPSGDIGPVPSIFSFGDNKPKLVQKSEYEKMADELWDDFDFAMGLNNVGSYNVDECEEAHQIEIAVDSHILCSKDKHDFVLDEQIGIKCRYCSFVQLEIKFVVPSCGTCTGVKSGRQNTGTEDNNSILNNFRRADKSNGKEGSFSSTPGTVWDLLPRCISETMYKHQQEAFEFMWTNLVGGTQLHELNSGIKSDAVGGCVIAHAPGTGKTQLALVFIYSYMKAFPECRPAIVAPRGMLPTWEEEYQKLKFEHPVHNLNSLEYSGKEADEVRELAAKDPRSKKWMRLLKLFSWAKSSGILLISYSLFNKLAAERSVNDPEISRILLEKPSLFVFDEGHTPRNERSLIWKALEKVKTEQRIILSGTLFQNNVREFYNSLRLVRPKFVQKISSRTAEMCQKKGLKVGTCDIEFEALEELRSITKPFMHVYKGEILDKLPGLRDCFVYLDILPEQKSTMEKLEEYKSGSFDQEHKISLVSIHPSLVMSYLSKKEKSVIGAHYLQNLRLNPNEGVKTRFVVELVRLCQARKERVLVFSQYIDPLSLIKEQLVKIFTWTEGKEVLQMDGKIRSKDRQSSINAFNDSMSEAKVLLASIRACGEGISLVGASRVILLDVVWNPAVERQAISRAFRLGQEKHVYTYHLITPGTGETNKHDSQTRKEHLSKMVFSQDTDGLNAGRNSLLAEEEWSSSLISEDEILKEMIEHEKLKDMFLRVEYPPSE